MEAFGDRMRQLREKRDLSLRGLAKAAHLDAGALSRYERGTRPVTRDAAEALDTALDARGSLLELAPDRGDPDERPDSYAQVSEAAAASTRLAEWARQETVSQLRIEHLRDQLERIAVEYVHSPAQPLFDDLVQLRGSVEELLGSRPHPNQARELFFLGGVTITLLAHASQNLGNSIAAMEQAMAAGALAEQADHPGLRGWVAGTQALISEWGQPSRAAQYAQQGALYVPAGEGAVRTAALQARSLARAGDTEGARSALRALSAAEDSAPASQVDDLSAFGGVLGFPAAKATYYRGSTLALLGDYQAAEDCALQAISTYISGPAEQRSYGDEALARCDVADARLGQGELDGAAEALDSVLSLPQEQRIKQITDRLHRIRRGLLTSRYAQSGTAQAVTEQITAFSPPEGNPRALRSAQ